MKHDKFSFKKDQYKSARGGYSRVLNVYCNNCNSEVLTYQKDGPGSLKRLYFDRIFHPAELSDLQKQELSFISDLKCSNCREVLGTPYVYKKENRKAFRIYQDSIFKKIIKLNQ